MAVSRPPGGIQESNGKPGRDRTILSDDVHESSPRNIQSALNFMILYIIMDHNDGT